MSRDHATTTSTHRRRAYAWWLIAVTTFALLPGCSGMSWVIPGTKGALPDEDRERTRDAMVRQFEARRNAMEIEAAEAALNRGDYKDSEQALRSILDRDPAHRDARLLLAEVMLLTGRRPEAFTQLEHALREHGDDPRVHYAMALLLDASGKPNEARGFYSRSAELDPGFALYATTHDRMLDAEGALSAGEAVAYHSRSDGVVQNASLVSGSDEKARSSEPSLENPDFKAGTTAIASDATMGTNVFDDRSRSCLNPESDRLLQKGREALNAGSPESAILYFRDAANVDPHNPQIPIHAAVLALEQNCPTIAVDILKPVTEQFARTAAVHLTLGTAYYRLGDYPSSQVALRQALSLDNSNGLAYLLMGCTLEKLGQPEAARVQWERAAAICPRYRNMRR